MKITGIVRVNSFSLDSWMRLVCVPASVLHEQSVDISTLSWWTAEVLAVLLGDITLQTHLVKGPLILAGHGLHIAVRKDCGLKNPASQMQGGMLKSETQCSSSRI